MFAEDAAQSLRRYEDTTQEQRSSLLLPAGLLASDGIEGTMPDTANAILLLAPELSLNQSDIEITQYAAVRHGEQAATIQAESVYSNDMESDDQNDDLQTCNDYASIVRVQQMSCELANDVLDYPAPEPTWTWNSYQESPAGNQAGQLPARDDVYPRSSTARHTESIHRSTRDSLEEQYARPENPYDRPSRTEDGGGSQLRNERGENRRLDASTSRAIPPSGKHADDESSLDSPYDHEEAFDSNWKDETDPLLEDQVHATQDRFSASPSGRDSLYAGTPPMHSNQRFPTIARLAASSTIKGDEVESASEEKRGDDDKFARLEAIMLAQRDEQLKREAAIEAERKAEKVAVDKKARKEAAEKKAAAESAKLLLDAATKARHEAELKAEREARETRRAHQEALAEAREAEKALIQAEMGAPVIFEDAIGRKCSCPWEVCSTWEASSTIT